MNLIPVGGYLYATPRHLQQQQQQQQQRGSLHVHFATPGPHRLVVAYGRRYRKDRYSREATSESERELFKPVRARLLDQGKTAVFDHLAPDFYDLIVVDDINGLFFEGLQLLQATAQETASENDKSSAMFKEVADSLSLREDRIGGWEAFFDHKNFLRFDHFDNRGAMLVHQKRLGRTYAESGDSLARTVHSLDLVWLEKAGGDAGWQVVTRQQLYRHEIASREFFTHFFVKDLQGIRVGRREVSIGPIALPQAEP